MIINGFNSDDYIYFRMFNDYGSYKKGDILRYNIKDLRNMVLSDRISSTGCFFEFIPKKKVNPNAIFPHQLYECAVINTEAGMYQMRYHEGEIMIINEAINKLLFTDLLSFDEDLSILPISKINQNKIDSLKPGEVLFDRNIGVLGDCSQARSLFLADEKSLPQVVKDFKIDKILHLKYVIRFNMDLELGDRLDLSDPAIALMFCDQNYLCLFFNATILEGKEKVNEFQKDFSNCVLEDGLPINYFKLNENIKVKSGKEFLECDCFPDDFRAYLFDDGWQCNLGYNSRDDFDYDNDGFLRFVCIKDCKYLEDEMLKISQRATIDEAKEHHEHHDSMIKLDVEAWSYYCNHKSAYKKMKASNPNLTYVEFMEKNEEKVAQQKYYMRQKLINSLKNRLRSLSSNQIDDSIYTKVKK